MNASKTVLAAPAALAVALATLACGQQVQGKDPEPAATAAPAAAEGVDSMHFSCGREGL